MLKLTVELICDNVHIHPSVVRLAFKLFTDEHVILISDTMRACGLEDGCYDLGGQQVEVKGNLATLASDSATIAGSVTNLMNCLRCAVKTNENSICECSKSCYSQSGKKHRCIR